MLKSEFHKCHVKLIMKHFCLVHIIYGFVSMSFPSLSQVINISTKLLNTVIMIKISEELDNQLKWHYVPLMI